MKKLAILPLLALGLWAMGCGGGNSAGSGLTCDVGAGSAGHACYAYPASANLTTCPQGSSVSSCPSTNKLGTCTVMAGGVSASVTYYSDGGLTAMQAQSGCTQGGGTWSS
jgi:hypothetical protein